MIGNDWKTLEAIGKHWKYMEAINAFLYNEAEKEG